MCLKIVSAQFHAMHILPQVFKKSNERKVDKDLCFEGILCNAKYAGHHLKDKAASGKILNGGWD